MSIQVGTCKNIFQQHFPHSSEFEGQGSIVVRVHASHAEGLRLESDSIP